MFTSDIILFYIDLTRVSLDRDFILISSMCHRITNGLMSKST